MENLAMTMQTITQSGENAIVRVAKNRSKNNLERSRQFSTRVTVFINRLT